VGSPASAAFRVLLTAVGRAAGAQTELKLSLHSLQADDVLCGGDLVRSIALEGQHGDQTLAQLHYQGSGDASEVLDSLALRFNRLHLEWNPTTVAALLAFVRRPAEAEQALTEAAAAEAEAPTEAAATPRRAASGGMTINAELQALSVSLNTDGSGERLALLGMQELVVDTLLSAEGGMMMKGQLGNLTAQDTYTVPGSPYEMLGLRAAEQSLLTFEYESPSDAARAASRARFEYDHVLRLKMSSVRVSYWHAAVMHTWDYLQSGVLGALVSATASTVVQAARSVLEAGTEASALALHVEVGSPLVLLPTAAGAADGLLADLGRIGVSNTLERKREEEGRAFGAAGVEASVFLDCIRVTVEQMQLSARGEGGEDGGDEAPGPVICMS
jgi:hypothetical protein